jgi:ribonuclease HII
MICGVDEAGRGALIGPLVISFVCFDSLSLKTISEIVTKDSKQLTPSQREALFPKIEKLAASIETHKVLPQQIDAENINKMERKMIADFVERKKPDEMFIDLFDHDGTKMTNQLKAKGAGKVVAEHKADENYPVVACASIIAKVTRDAEIKKLHKICGFFGSGYPADERTVEFVKNPENYAKVEPFVRKKWATLRNLGIGPKNVRQRKL